MKCRRLRRMARRAAALVLALASLVPTEALTARAAQMKSTETKIIVWDKIDDMQSIGGGADYDPANENRAIPVGETKYSRILIYRNESGNRYYVNASPFGGGSPGWFSSYEANKVYLDTASWMGNSVHSEWYSDFLAVENGGCFVTRGGMRTPYIQYVEVKESYHSWRLWAANTDDTWSNFALMLEDDYEELNVRRTDGYDRWAQSRYGAKNDVIRSDPWIFNKSTHVVPQSRWASHSDHVIWHWDNDTGGYDEALEFDNEDRKLRAWNIDTGGADEFKIFLGKEYKVGTLAENFTVQADQTQTLGKPLYYIPKGKTITVERDATLVIDGALLNDGTIIVKDGGLLKIKDDAKIFPLTKQDNDCGHIDSTGSIIIGADAVLCGGANNGVRIGKGGVVNFGILCGESMMFERNDLIDNRVDDMSDHPAEGWIIAGRSPTGAARGRFIKEAILNNGTTTKIDRARDFGKVSSAKSIFTTQLYSVYGDGKDHIDTTGVGETAYGSASNPTLSVYTCDRPGDNTAVLFQNEMLEDVSLRVDGTKAIFTSRDKEYTVENKLISAVIGRGSEKLTLFRDMWVGKLDGAFVQMEPANAEGKCMVLRNNGTGNGTNVVIYDRDKKQTNKCHWWKLSADGSSGGVSQRYLIESYGAPDKVLDLPGSNTASSGNNVQLNSRDTGTDQRWLLVPDAHNADRYYIRNDANNGVSLRADGTGNNANVSVATSAVSADQRWTFINLFDEESYTDSIREGAAMELIPQNATGLRLDLTGAEEGAGAAVYTANGENVRQRWELRQAGSESLRGVTTPYFMLFNKDTQKVLTVNGDYKTGTGVAAKNAQMGRASLNQYWYLESSGGTCQYYVVARGNTNFVLQASGSGSGSAVQIATKGNQKKEQMWEITGAAGTMSQAEGTAREAQSDPFYNKAIEMVPSEMSDRKLTGTLAESSLGKVSSVDIDSAPGSGDFILWSFRYLGRDSGGPYYQLVPSKSDINVAMTIYDQDEVKHNSRAALSGGDSTSNRQQWRVTQNADGTYSVTLRSNGNLALGTRVYTYDVTDLSGGGDSTKLTNSTYWPVLAEKTETIKSKSTSSRILQKKESKHETTTVITRTNWKFTLYDMDPLEDKSFVLSPKTAPQMVVGLKYNKPNTYYDKAVLKQTSTSDFERWTIKRAGVAKLDGKDEPYYTISNLSTRFTVQAEYRTPYEGQDVETGNGSNYYPCYWFLKDMGDGYVSIINRDYPGFCLDLKNGSTAPGTYLCIGTTGSKDSQKWKFTELSDYDPFDGGVFYLTPKHAPGMVLDLCGNGTSDGTMVQLYDKKETEIQRWRFERVGKESVNGKAVNVYIIHSVYAAGKALDVPGGNTANGSRPQLWGVGDSNVNRKWIMEEAGGGYYRIVPRENTTKCIDCYGDDSGKSNGTVVQLWDKLDVQDQRWQAIPTVAPTVLGTYELESVGKAGMSIDVVASSNTSGEKLEFYASHAKPYTRWQFVLMGTDEKGPYFRIVNKGSNLCMDIYGVGPDTAKEGNALLQSNYDYNDDQLWYYEKTGSDDLGDYFAIKNRQDTRYRIGVKDSKYENGQELALTTGTGDNTKWRMNTEFTPVDLGVYEFGVSDSAHVDQRMDVDGAGTSNGTNVQSWRANSSKEKTAQTFRILQRGNTMYNGNVTPYYSIENTYSGKTLDPPGTGEGSDGQNVQQWDYDGYSDQHWFMEVRGDNTVVFRNRANPKLVLAAESAGNGANVALKTYDEKKLNIQAWQLHPVMRTDGAEQYYIAGNAAAVAAGIPHMQKDNVILNPALCGKYTLAPQHAATLRMDLSYASTTNGTAICAVTNNGSNAQRWKIVPAGVDYFDGNGKIFYRIAYGDNTDKALDMQDYGPIKASWNAQIYDKAGFYDQEWYFEEVGGKENTYYIIGRGTMHLTSKVCLGVPAGATSSGTQIQSATLRNKNYQQWEVEYVD